MFKDGDKIVCVDDSLIHTVGGTVTRCCLSIGKTYTVQYIVDKDLVYITNDTGANRTYNFKRFKSLSTYRKQKIEKICSRLET